MLHVHVWLIQSVGRGITSTVQCVWECQGYQVESEVKGYILRTDLESDYNMMECCLVSLGCQAVTVFQAWKYYYTMFCIISDIRPMYHSIDLW